MSYYPTNFYSNYPYNNNYGSQYQPQMQQQPTMMQQPQQTIQTGLQGKIVDSLDVAKVADVPIGGYGIFPKADLSEVYIKSWNPNGTTGVVTYRPVIMAEEVKEENSNNQEGHNKLMERIEKLEEKLDEVLAQKSLPAANSTTKRKEF